MTRRISLYGAPGTGKTTRLTAQFVEAVRTLGPERVAATTFTRAAADELRVRASAALGLPNDIRALRRMLPWVGTTHSLALRLADLPPGRVVDGKKLQDFAPGT